MTESSNQPDPTPQADDTEPAVTPAQADVETEALSDDPPAGQYGPTADFGDG